MSEAEFEFGHRPEELDPMRRAKLESRNSSNLYIEIVQIALQSIGNRFELSSDLIRRLNWLAVTDVEPTAGQFRQVIRLASDHVPPNWRNVPTLVDEMCEHANASTDGFYASAFVLWRLNWIHPFVDGNGRVSRALAYLFLTSRLGEMLSGEFMSLIHAQEARYYQSLQAADQRWKNSEQNFEDPTIVQEVEFFLHDIYAGLQSS